LTRHRFSVKLLNKTSVRFINKVGGNKIRVANTELIEKRKHQLVIKAASLFVKKGYLQTSIRDIAEECGLSVGALYHYIHSKEDILSLFQEISSQEIRKFGEEHLATLFHMPPREGISCAIDALISFNDAFQDIVVFWYQESKNLGHEQLDTLCKREEYQVELLKKILMRGCDLGEFKIKDINLAAHDIIVLCDMWAFRRWSLRRDYTVEQFKDAQKNLILSRATGGCY